MGPARYRGRMRSPKRTLAASVLCFEALVVFFAGLVAKDLSTLAPATALTLGVALALACLLTAGWLRRPGGYLVGSALQVVVIATGVWVGAMFFLGGVFALLWVVAIRLGGRLELEYVPDVR